MLTIERHIAEQGYDRIHCRANPVALPLGNKVLMLTQDLLIRATDCFSNLSLLQSEDGGQTWGKPEPVPALADTAFSDGSRQGLLADGMRAMPDGTVLVWVDTFRYDAENKLDRAAFPQRAEYLYFDPVSGAWSERRGLPLEVEDDADVLAHNAQITEEAGDFLLPYSVRQPSMRFYARIARLHRAPDGTITRRESSDPIRLERGRGFFEPSLIRFGGKYFLSLRNDESGYVTCSDTWRSFPEAKKWCFDNGEWLGNYNTMTRFLRLGGKLYLVYTRKGLNNDHVFRHRAPLMIGEVDPETCRVIAATEEVVVPEYGARLGNFTAVNIDADHAYVSVAEWMQTLEPAWHECEVCEKYGANNRSWYVELRH